MKYENLIFIRNRLGLSQRELAQKLNVSKSTYARWETGENIIPLNHLIDLCNYAKVTPDYILNLTNKKNSLKTKIILNNKMIGQKIKQIRKNNNLTQKEMAKAINTTQSVISAYENGLTNIQTAFLYDICIKLNISATWLLQ